MQRKSGVVAYLFVCLACLIIYTAPAQAYRFYDADMGRFLSPDPLGDVNGAGLYNFCGGDSVNRADPMGTDFVYADREHEVWYQGETWLGLDVGARIYLGRMNGDRVEFDAAFNYTRNVGFKELSEIASGQNRGAASFQTIYKQIIPQAARTYQRREFWADQIRRTGGGQADVIALNLAADAGGGGFGPVEAIYTTATGNDFRSGCNVGRMQGASNLALMAAFSAAGGGASYARGMALTPMGGNLTLYRSFAGTADGVEMDFRGITRISGNGLSELQELTTAANIRLGANPGLAKAVLYPEEYSAGQGSPGVARMFYGHAVERMVRDDVGSSPFLRQFFKYKAGAGRPDFIGQGPYDGINYDITTELAVPTHELRWYQPLIPTYVRPSTFQVFP